MRKYTGFVIAWVLFAMGDFISRIQGWLCRPYQSLMTASERVQEWSGHPGGPWQPIEAEEWPDTRA